MSELVTKLRVIAFDLGKNMAWAFSGEDGKPMSGWQFFKGKRVDRAAGTYVWLRDLLSLFADSVDVVCYERPFARGFDATRSLWGIAGLIEALATAAGLPVIDVTPSEIKVWATGRGDAEKADMIAVAAQMGYDKRGKDEEAIEHESDAFCLLRFMEATLTKSAPPEPRAPRKTVKGRDQTRKDLPK